MTIAKIVIRFFLYAIPYTWYDIGNGETYIKGGDSLWIRDQRDVRST